MTKARNKNHEEFDKQHDPIKNRQKLDKKNDKDLTRMLLLKFMSELVAARGDEMLRELEAGGREEVMRRHVPLSQRERKAGCRNFFWKTFTSC
uniref:Somatostatin/Cortistatin C-terminal domain-containing protein n=1 Tax=Acanthochromis polyacanthus TaxID=80966 RepID=A0A3Q1FM94_9TELE